MDRMTWDPDSIDREPDVRIERDGHALRRVLHLTQPFTHGKVESAADLAAIYLHVLAKLFGIDRSSLPQVAGAPRLSLWLVLARLLRSVPLLRWMLWFLPRSGVQLDPKPDLVKVRDGESVAVIFRQVQRVNASWFPPVWGAGIRVMVARSPLRVTSVYSTLRYELPRTIVVAGPSPFPATRQAAAELLGIAPDTVEGLFVYECPESPGSRRRIRDFAPVVVYGRMDDPGLGDLGKGRRLPYRNYYDLSRGEVIRTEVLAACVRGLVFPIDPRSQSAGSEPGPYRPAAELDIYRRHRRLWDLTAAAPGADQELRGARVYVAQDNPLGLDPPTKPAGADFDSYYASRSDHFAAVSAYYHCDAAFRMVEALGFPLPQYFAANVAFGKFPIRVVHRAPIRPGPAVFDGRTVNAQVTRDQYPHVVGEIRFALADLSDAIANPIGIAADARFAWHEFGHVLLIAATGEPEFRFAHSAGDALAAIICDLESNVAASQQLAPWRGVTFPWVEALRRHDRPVRKGWGWHGSLYDRATYAEIRDPAGYRAEQILSSTLFRLYLALGGDAWKGTAPDFRARRAAAAYTVYLVVRAIQALGTATTIPALDAYALAEALMDADVATAYLLPNGRVFPAFRARPRRGGAVHKVVRWAFERQGLYAPPNPPGPWNEPGNAEPVDVYIEDGRHGEYNYAETWDAKPPDLRIAANPNPNDPESSPHVNTSSYVFVRVYNRGTDPNPQAATVKVFATRAPTLRPPRWRLAPGPSNPWTALPAAAGAVTTAVVPRAASGEFGPFEWRPVLPGPHHLLACVDAPGDRCNALDPTLACAVGPTRLAHLVPFDNNIGYRGVGVQP